MNMKICLLFVVCVLILVPATCVAAVVASYDMAWQNIAHENIPSCTLDLYVSEGANTSAKIMSESITPSDVGLTFTATSSDPGFTSFVNYITNGTNGSVVVELKSPGGKDLSGWFSESDVFGKPSTGISDLQGCASISSVSLKINNFTLLSPGTNPWGDGICTFASCDFGFSVNAVPEPCTIAVLLLGVPFLRKKTK